MQRFSLIDSQGALVRQEEFVGQPPVLAQGKGLRWVLDEPPAYDPETQYPPRPVVPVTGAAVEYVVEAIPLKDKQAEVISAINATRDRKETEGFDYLGKRFQSDERSAARIANAALTASTSIATGQPFSVDWAAADNTTVTLDAGGMLAMQAALTQRAAILHYYGRSLKARVEAAAALAELAGIDIEAGWPA
jgi:hypothetical protein